MSHRTLSALLLVVLLAGSLAADTIVLKNGRRIQAGRVEERGGRVYWETQAGSFSLPKRLVERIERSDAPAAPRRLVEKAPVTPVASLETADIGQVVVNGRVDRALVARLENAANKGDPTARRRAAAAHVAIAQHLYGQGEVAATIASFQRALVFAPNHPLLLLNLASLYYTQRDYPNALEALARAGRKQEFAFEVLRLRGLIQYEMEKLDAAIATWKQALALRADAELQQWLVRAQGEAQVTRGYGETGSGRFTLRYSGEAAASPRLVREVLNTLERDFADLSSRLDYLPREPFVVLLYTNEAFTSVTGAPAWVDAVHDGKLRLPVQGLTSLTARLREVLRHELSHAFIRDKSRNRAPRWLHEGLGQWFEGMRSRQNADVLRQVVAERERLPLAGIDALLSAGSFQEVAVGYLLALAVVETMIDIYGMNGINRLLEELSRGATLDAALWAGYRMDRAELERAVLDRLQRRYAR